MVRVRALYRDVDSALNARIFKDKWELLVSFPGNLPFVFSALHSARIIPQPSQLYRKTSAPKKAWLALTKPITTAVRAINYISNRKYKAKEHLLEDGLIVGIYIHESPVTDSELSTPFTYNLEDWSDFSLDDESHSVERMVGTSPSPGDFNSSDFPQSEEQGVFSNKEII